MPIYAYRCTACGHAKDVLQKISDPVLTECPACGAQTFAKQVTAAGFQLKGSGWYVTDFRGGAQTQGDAPKGETAQAVPAKPEAPKADAPAASPAPAASAAPAATAPPPAPGGSSTGGQ